MQFLLRLLFTFNILIIFTRLNFLDVESDDKCVRFWAQILVDLLSLYPHFFRLIYHHVQIKFQGPVKNPIYFPSEYSE